MTRPTATTAPSSQSGIGYSGPTASIDPTETPPPACKGSKSSALQGTRASTGCCGTLSRIGRVPTQLQAHRQQLRDTIVAARPCNRSVRDGEMPFSASGWGLWFSWSPSSRPRCNWSRFGAPRQPTATLGSSCRLWPMFSGTIENTSSPIVRVGVQ